MWLVHLASFDILFQSNILCYVRLFHIFVYSPYPDIWLLHNYWLLRGCTEIFVGIEPRMLPLRKTDLYGKFAEPNDIHDFFLYNYFSNICYQKNLQKQSSFFQYFRKPSQKKEMILRLRYCSFIEILLSIQLFKQRWLIFIVVFLLNIQSEILSRTLSKLPASFCFMV